MVDQDVSDEIIPVGHVSGAFGVRGWVKLHSLTDPRENILTYSPLLMKVKGEWKPVKILQGQRHGKGVTALLEGVSDRNQAEAMAGVELAIWRSQLPELEDDEFYWSDLIGLEVVTTEGVLLGKVDHLLETGANDVLVVQGSREHLVPYLPGDVIEEIDLVDGRMVVDWDPDF